MVELSKGNLKKILKGEIDGKNSILQILKFQPINYLKQKRYVIAISDGEGYITSAMLSFELNRMVLNGQLSRFSVVEITSQELEEIKLTEDKRKIPVIKNLIVRIPGQKVKKRIGDPGSINDHILYVDPPSQQQSNPSEPTKSKINKKKRPAASLPDQNSPSCKKLCRANDVKEENIILTSPILAVTPYVSKNLVIKARVVSKSAIRSWGNSQKSGKVFSLILKDESGEIRCTGFADTVEKFYDLLQVGKVYYISKCDVKNGHSKFNTVDHRYELALCVDSKVSLCHERIDTLPKMEYNFVPLNTIAKIPINSFIDVIGIVMSVDDIKTIISQASGNEIKKRDIYLLDTSNIRVTLGLWGNQAVNLKASENEIIVAKGVQVREFKQRKVLSALMETTLELNPDIPEAEKLRIWNCKERNQVPGLLPMILPQYNAAWLSLAEVQERQKEHKKPFDFMCRATIALLRDERAIYRSCPVSGCNKKVELQEDGTYKCGKCAKSNEKFRWRILLKAIISDWTDEMWVTIFNDIAEIIIGATAAELGNMNFESFQFRQRFEAIEFKTFNFGIRMDLEKSNNELQLRGTVVYCEPLDYRTLTNKLIKDLKKLTLS